MRDAEHRTSRHGGESHRSGSRSDLRFWRRIYVETAGYRLAAVALMMIEFLATPLFLLSPIPLAIVVDSVLGDKPLPNPVDAILPDSITPTQLLVLAAVLQIGVVLLTDLQTLSQNALRTWTQEKLTLRMRSQLFTHVQRLSFAFHDRRGSADSLYRIQYDSTALGGMIVTNLLPLFSALITLVSVFVVIVGINTELALIALATTPFLAVLSNRSKKQMRHHYRESKKLDSSAMGVVHEVLGNVRVVKAFGREDSEHRRFLRWGDASAKKRVGIATRESMLDLAVNLITAAGTGLVLFVGAQSVLSGAITIGALLIVINYLARLYTPLKTLTRRVAGMQNAYESLQRAFELLDQEPDVAERPDALPIQRARGDVEFEKVSFAYKGEPFVLEDVSIHIPSGTRLGIVGRTGAGKTTLVSLLMRFYDVSSGVIRLDGKDVRDLRIADLRNQFAIVLQEPVLFSTSVADNIRYGKPDATQDEIRQAAETAGIAEFIDRLPEGYNTLVGERGQRLSGGERQRIALARAFLKDAPILILDEPTSAVDTATESSILQAMESLAYGRTTFMIAHRLSTLKNCDMIIRVEDGKCSVVRLAPLPSDGTAHGGQDTLPDRPRSIDAAELRPQPRALERLARRGWAEARAAPGARAPGKSAVTGRDGQRDLPMVDGLESAMSDSGRPGLRELRGVLAELLDAPQAIGRLVGEHCLKERKVYRLEFEVDGRRRSLIVRCVDPTRAELNRRVATRWLPAVGLDSNCATLFGVASDPSAQWIWQVHEDLGDQTLENSPDRGLVEAAIDICAELHVRFADHPLLPECRMYGQERGITYYLASIRDAIRGLEHLQLPTTDADASRLAVRDRLLGRLHQLLDEGPERAGIVAEHGGPETMLHGDLFPKNMLTVSTENGLRAALIDWDQAGAGPLTYDLSTLLYRSPAEHRTWILDRYQQSVAPLGWRVPSTAHLNITLETAELSRIANYLVWVCVAAREPPADWLLESLEEVERWFESLEPAIRSAPATRAVAGLIRNNA